MEKENNFSFNDLNVKKEIAKEIDEYKENKCFQDVWSYLMDVLSKSTSREEDLKKYKHKKFIINFLFHFIVYFVLLLLVIIIVWLATISYYFKSDLLSYNYNKFAAYLLSASIFVLWIPFFFAMKYYFLNKKKCKLNAYQIINFDKKEYLANLNFDVLKNFYQQSCFYNKFEFDLKPSIVRIGKNKTCTIYSYEKIFNYFLKIKNKLDEGKSFLDIYFDDFIMHKVVVKTYEKK